MALRQLAGPFTIKHTDGTPAAPTSGGPSVWHRDVGLIMDLDFCYSIVSMDGIAESISFWLRPGTVGWWSSAQRMLALYANFTATEWFEFILDRKTFIHASAAQGTGALPFNRYVKLPDGRRLYNWILSDLRTYADDGTITPEGIEAIKPFQLLGALWAGRHEWEVFVCEAVGGFTPPPTSFAFYNAKTKTFSQKYTIGLPANDITYVPEWDVVISLHNGHTELRVWSLEVLPATLSEPQLIAGELQGGHLATFEVQALGDQGEPCVGEYIDWAISGAGKLLSTQSQTDENGKAQVRVMYPLTDSGTSIVTAGLRC